MTMAPFNIRRQLNEEIDRLEPEQQHRLLELARGLTVSPLPKGMTWEHMKQYAGTLPDDDAAEILAAIEEDCENIDLDEW
jgi:hypothetical protein